MRVHTLVAQNATLIRARYENTPRLTHKGRRYVLLYNYGTIDRGDYVHVHNCYV